MRRIITFIVLVGAACQDDVTGTRRDLDGDAEDAEVLFNTTTDATAEVETVGPGRDFDCSAPGEPGCPCSENADCNSFVCIASPDGPVCTAGCISECPDGWTCAAVSAGGPDVTFICVPRHTSLCRPCRADDECESLGVQGNRCLPTGADGGSYCGTSCDDESDCPEGYGCASLTIEEHSVTQCVPDDNVCTCNAYAIAQGDATDCTRSNALGSCTGERRCSEGGLTACSALEPDTERCNALDDDCDGTTDGITESCQVANAFGSCTGSRTCIGGTYGSCIGPVPQLEVCNGADDDCDGVTDEGTPDSDGDQIADACETDDDDDGVPDVDDVCPTVPDPAQGDCDGDGQGDACSDDDDGDGTLDGEDCGLCDATVHPGAVDGCNSLDDDCDESIDEDCRVELGRVYAFGSGFVLGAEAQGVRVGSATGLRGAAGSGASARYRLRPVHGVGGPL